jgi:hypothetical protein
MAAPDQQTLEMAASGLVILNKKYFHPFDLPRPNMPSSIFPEGVQSTAPIAMILGARWLPTIESAD